MNALALSRPEYLEPAMPDDSSNVVPFRSEPKREPLWTSTGPAWSILRVTSNMARKVAVALGPKTEDNPCGVGLRTYVPIEKYRPVNQWRAKTRPLIPGYVFAEILNDEQLDLARKNYAVHEIMCHQGTDRPVTLPAVMIGTMAAMEALHLFDRTWKPVYLWKKRGGGGPKGSFRASRWENGKRIRILDGPFAGFLGTVMSTPRDLRINVVTAIFGRETTIELGENDVEAEAPDEPEEN